MVRDDTRAWLAALPRTAALPGVAIAHGSPHDPEEYVRSEARAAGLLGELTGERVLVLGGSRTAHSAGAPGHPPAAGPAPKHAPIEHRFSSQQETGEPQGPEEVLAGVYVSNIQSVSLATNSFDADFYVWLRWRNPDLDPTAGIEVMNPYMAWGLITTPVYD